MLSPLVITFRLSNIYKVKNKHRKRFMCLVISENEENQWNVCSHTSVLTCIKQKI